MRRITDGGIDLTWTAAPGWKYHVEIKDDLAAVNWAIAPGTIEVTGSVARFSVNTGLPRRFYRVVANAQ